MPDRLMYVQLKTGYDSDQGPAWIGWVRFNRSWKTATFHGRTLRRSQGISANFYDVDSDEEFWLSGPKRDRTDGRHSSRQPLVDDDALPAYRAFLAGAPLPGRERG